MKKLLKWFVCKLIDWLWKDDEENKPNVWVDEPEDWRDDGGG